MTTAESAPAAFKVEAGADRLGRSIYVVGSDITVKVASRDTHGAFAVMEDVTPPGGGPPLHLHREQDEWWYIFESEFLFVVDGREIHARPGDTVFAPRGSVHTFQNIGDRPGRTIVTVVPGGLDEFFVDLEQAVPRGTVPDPGKIIPVFDKHGLELHGPPLAARRSATA